MKVRNESQVPTHRIRRAVRALAGSIDLTEVAIDVADGEPGGITRGTAYYAAGPPVRMWIRLFIAVGEAEDVWEWLLAHELGHIRQYQSGWIGAPGAEPDPDAEADADRYADEAMNHWRA